MGAATNGGAARRAAPLRATDAAGRLLAAAVAAVATNGARIGSRESIHCLWSAAASP